MKNQKFTAEIQKYQIKNNTTILLLTNIQNKSKNNIFRDHLFLKIPKDIFNLLKEKKAKQIEFNGEIENYEHANYNNNFISIKKRINKPHKFNILKKG